MEATFIVVLILLAAGVNGGPPISLNTCPEVTDRSTYCEKASSWMCEFVNWKKLSNEWRELMESRCSFDEIREGWEEAFECLETDDVECVNADQHTCETACNCTFCYCMDGKYQNWNSLFSKWKAAKRQYQQRIAIFQSQIMQCTHSHERECDSEAPTTVATYSTGSITTTDTVTTPRGSTPSVSEPTTTYQLTTTVPEPTTTNQPTTTVPEATTTNQPTTTVPEATTTNEQTTTVPAEGEHCNEICLRIRNGSIDNAPIALVTEGSAAKIFPDFAPDGVDVYCDCTDGPDGAWTVFQRRMDGSVDFFRDWNDYANGFGNVSGEFWLGLDAISNFTSGGGFELRIDLEDWKNDTAYAEYSTFSVADSYTNYTLTVDEYNGTAGDSFMNGDSQYHHDQQFSTLDRDNDNTDWFGGSCANHFVGAWWFHTCYVSHLNGQYFQGGLAPPGSYRGIVWHTWIGYNSLKTTEMKFREI